MGQRLKRDEFDAKLTKRELKELERIEKIHDEFNYSGYQMNIDYFGNTQSFMQEQIRRAYNG